MTDKSTCDVLSKRLAIVEARIVAACGRAGRPRREVTLVAVTKTVTASVASLLPGLGILDLGENRPQELWHKAAVAPTSVRWHLIGHLQRNKIERTVLVTTLIHSVDSLRLLQALELEAAKHARSLEILLEMNASREASKQGFQVEEIESLVPHLRELRHLRVRGLMTMAALTDNAEDSRATFRATRLARDRLQHGLGTSDALDHLSMGMTNDFEVAIEEGATLVRVGTAIFGGLEGAVD